MKHLTGLGYNATGTENDFAIFFGAPDGKRGRAWDADNFRGGDYKKLGRLIIETADRLKVRADALVFEPDDAEGGGMSARLYTAIKTLIGIGRDLADDSGKEPDDYHWLIVSELISVITVLFDYIEARV